MADSVEEKGTGDVNKSAKSADKAKQKDKHNVIDVVPIHKRISDVAQFSYAALCATALHTLFETDNDKKFREEALGVILISLEQPQQVCESVRAMLQGHGLDDLDPYIDILLAEDVLKGGAEPIVSQLLAISIGQGCYDARMRVMVKHVAWRLRVNWDVVEDIEAEMSATLVVAHYEMSEEEKIEQLKKEKRRKFKRYALIGLATVGGGTLIGLTGGLAAPLVAAGAGAIIGGAGAAALGSVTGVALIGSLFGVAGAGLTGHKMKKRVGAVEEFEFEPLVCGNTLRVENLSSQLHITIAITGWLSNQMRDFRQPWKNLAESREQYTLRWETKYLVQLGEALNYIFNSAMAMATQEALKYTVLNGLLAAIAWPAALLSASSIIDNPWSVALQRSQAAGRMLAEVLLEREQGNRPVTLIGYSLGAKVIFSCLEELTKRKCCEGIVEDVIMLGTPATGDPKIWSSFSKVVAGKIVNGFCRGDWMLKFLYRTSSVQMNIAGLRPIDWADRRMHNIDLSDVVAGHMDYMSQLDIIMKAVGVQTRDEVARPTGLRLRPKRAEAAGDSEYDLSMDDISSSDDEMYTQVLDAVTSPTQPVILEDYTGDSGAGKHKDSAVRYSGRPGSDEDSNSTSVIPESMSFDSGVEITRAELEVKEGMATSGTGSGMEKVFQSSDDGTNSSKAGSILRNGDSSKDKDPSGVGSEESGYRSLTEEARADNLLVAGVDRVGDAGANGDSSNDDDDDLAGRIFTSSSVENEESTVEDLTSSNLQRKKMFDSMYRLVLDDDILNELGEEDDITLSQDGSGDDHS